MYDVLFTKQAAKDAKKLKSAGLDGRAKQLTEIVRANPFQRPPAYEAPDGNLSGLYSRRINVQHRFVYQVIAEPAERNGVAYEGTVKVLSMWSHYEGLR